MKARFFALSIGLALVVMAGSFPVSAQSSREIGEMRLYIQQLEAQVRELTGENEQLKFELRKLRQQAGVTGGAQSNDVIVRGAINPQNNSSAAAGAPAQDLGTLSVSENDPLIAGDGAGTGLATATGTQPDTTGAEGAGTGAPLDLSALAAGSENVAVDSGTGLAGQDQAIPQDSPQLTASITGAPRDEYDLAYGYVLTGDYPFAEVHFKAWLGQFPDHALADDARFWLAEAQLKQGKNQEAASGFLDLYKRVPNSPKGPDTLVKLGVALVGLGEKEAACATFAEVARKYPDATGATRARVANEQQRADC